MSTPQVVSLSNGNGETIEALASQDPTNSETQRNRFQSRFTTRWRTLRGEVRSLIQGKRRYRPTSHRATNSEKIADFRDWLERTVSEIVVESRPHRAVRRGRHWTAPFTGELYIHGIEQADKLLQAIGWDFRATPPNVAIRHEPHRDILRGLYIETYQDLEDAARAATKDATRSYRDAVRAGFSVNDTISAVNDRLDKVGRYRTDLVSQSKSIITINTAAAVRYGQVGADSVGVAVETIPGDEDALAHCCSQKTVEALQNEDEEDEEEGGISGRTAGIAAGIGGAAFLLSSGRRVNVTQTEPEHEFVTAGDDRVCPICLDLAGNRYSLADVINGNAPMPVRSTHPRCRCLVYPA